MEIGHLLLIVLFYVVPVALGMLVLYFVVRMAVLSALRTHHAERSAGPSPATPPRAP